MINFLLVLSSLFTGSSQKLSIPSQNIENSFKEAEISYQQFPMGTFPHGRIIYGYLHYQKENDACS